MEQRLTTKALTLSLVVLVIMIVAAPMLAFASESATASANANGGNSDAAQAAAPGQTGDAGNSAEAPGQNKTETTATTETSSTPGNAPSHSNAGGNSSGGSSAPSNSSNDSGGPGKSDEAPGNNGTSNGNGGSSSNSGSSSSGNGNGNGGNGNNNGDRNLDDGVGGGVGNSENQDKDRPSDASNGPGTGQKPAEDCTNKHQGGSNTGHGANQGSVYDNTCDGRPSENGQGGGNATGRPCQGCVGNADDKNPGANNGNGQYPGPKNDRKNRGYECDDNNGVGKGNPAHTGCQPSDPPDCLGHPLSLGHTHTADECKPKVLICHVNQGSPGYVLISVSKSAWDDDNGVGHQGHVGDKEVTSAADAATKCGGSGPEEAKFCHFENNVWSIVGPYKTDTTEYAQHVAHGDAVTTATSATTCETRKDEAKFCHFDSGTGAWSIVGPYKVGSAEHISHSGHGDAVTMASSANACFSTPPPKCPTGTDRAGEDMPSGGPTFCSFGRLPPPENPVPPPPPPLTEEPLPPDVVLGVRFNKPGLHLGPDKVLPAAVLPANVAAAGVLPFTGGNLLPFVIVGLTMIGTGAVIGTRRKAIAVK